jgi:pimeloyl-ACP methyl ester carboxylesterase
LSGAVRCAKTGGQKPRTNDNGENMKTVLAGLVAVIGLLVGTFFLLSTPDIPRSILEAKYATPPSQFLTLADGARVHYRDRGPRDAPVLVLVHGSNASLFTWEPWVRRLDDTFRVITIDMPGHGLTGAVPSNDYSQKGMADFVAAVADKIGLGKFAIGGNSMGGGVAARFAEDYPARVTALILVDAGGMPGKPGDHVPLGFRIGRTPVLNLLLLHITPRRIFAEGLHDSFVHQNLVTPAMITQYWELNRMAGTRQATLARFQLGIDDPYIKDHAGRITVPTLILWGAKDHLVPVADAHDYASAIAGSRLIVYPDAGHILQEDAADASAAAVRAFLGSLPR